MNMLNLILFLVIFVVLIAIIGKYLSNIINFKQYKGDKFFSKIYKSRIVSNGCPTQYLKNKRKYAIMFLYPLG